MNKKNKTKIKREREREREKINSKITIKSNYDIVCFMREANDSI
jgi:hypothetical protein